MILLLLVLASIIDVLLLALLVAVSGFVFGGGPEGMHGELSGVLVWTTGVVSCIAAPVAGFVLRRFRRAGIGDAVAWLPQLIALLITFGVFDPHY